MQITSDTHVDHALTPDHLAFILKVFASKEAFFLETIELPEALLALPCSLHGPIMGDPPIPDDEVTFTVRGSRPGPSRMCDRAPRLVRTMTVIGGPDDRGEMILYTAYGGPAAPREPWDPSLDDAQRLERLSCSL
jgi:hypothetical protein